MVWPDVVPEINLRIALHKQARAAKFYRECIFEDVLLKTDFRCLRESSEQFIYIFKLTCDNWHRVACDVRNALIEKKSSERNLKFPRVNKRCSAVLYVGSSRKNVVGRIRQHLGSGPRGTYALKMESWRKQGWVFQLHVRGYRDLDDGVLQIIEDSVSTSLKPMFGKLGGNGR